MAEGRKRFLEVFAAIYGSALRSATVKVTDQCA
jgi:hypothetical protein